MPIRTRLIQVGVAAAVAVTITGIGLSATAVDAVASGCTNVSAPRASAAATRTAIKQLNACLGRLDKVAESAGHAAQLADERYLQAKGAARSAATASARARTRAKAAADRAQASRTRAAMVALQLVRGGSASQAGLMLGGRVAATTLYGLSRMTQLAAEAHNLRVRAGQDSAEAAHLLAQADVQAQKRTAAATTARTAFTTAQERSRAVAKVVKAQRSRVRSLQAKLVSLEARAGIATSRGAVLTNLPPDASRAARAVAFARSQIGDPYVFAAAGPGSWDCSGLTLGAYESVGVSIGIHSATAQYRYARSHGRLVAYANRQPGDLLFYTDGGGDMYHITIYSGNGMMIEAPYEGVDVREVPVREHNLVGEVARPTG